MLGALGTVSAALATVPGTWCIVLGAVGTVLGGQGTVPRYRLPACMYVPMPPCHLPMLLKGRAMCSRCRSDESFLCQRWYFVVIDNL